MLRGCWSCQDVEFAVDNEYTVFLSDLFAGMGPVELRRMFGGQGLYHQDIIIGLIIGEALFLKTDEETRPRFEAGGGAPFIYTGKGKPVRTSYWSPPAEAFESAEDMLPWARLAWAAALRAAARKPAKRKRSLGDVRL